MSLEKHKTFSFPVIEELDRRSDNFGADHKQSTSAPSANTVFAKSDGTRGVLVPTELQTDKFDGKGGRSPWIRVSSGVVAAFDPDFTSSGVKVNVKKMDGYNVASAEPKENVDNIVGLILEPDANAHNYQGYGEIPKYQTIARTIKENTTTGTLDSNSSAFVQILNSRNRPSPIVENISVKHLGSYGLIKEATFTWKAFTLEQFNVLAQFFCNIQKTVILEWGWSSFNGNFIGFDNIENSIKLAKELQLTSTYKDLVRMELSKKAANNATVEQNEVEPFSQENLDAIANFAIKYKYGNEEQQLDNPINPMLMTPYEIFQLSQGVDYDCFVGVVVNFDISINEGIYVVTTTLQSASNAILGIRNDEKILNSFTTKFNKILSDYKNSNDPRIWSKDPEPQKEVEENEAERTAAEGQEQVTKELDDSSREVINTAYSIMTSPKNFVFWNPELAKEEWETAARRDVNNIIPVISPLAKVPEYTIKNTDQTITTDVITELGYISDMELIKLIVFRARLLSSWNIEPEIANTQQIGPTWAQPFTTTFRIGRAIYQLGSEFLDNMFNETKIWRQYLKQVYNRVNGRNVNQSLDGDPVKYVLDPGKVKIKGREYDYPEIYFDTLSSVTRRSDLDPLSDIDVYTWLAPLLSAIRFDLELYHRRSGELKLEPETGLWGARFGELGENAKVVAGTFDQIQDNLEVVYEETLKHLKENSGGRAYVDGFDAFLYGGWTNFITSRALYKDAAIRLKVPSGNNLNDEEVNIKGIAINQHRATVGSGLFRNTTTEKPPSDPIEKINKENAPPKERNTYEFITWGLFEDILNSTYAIDNPASFKVDSNGVKIKYDDMLLSSDSSVCIIPNRTAPQYNEQGQPEATGTDIRRVNLSINGVHTHRICTKVKNKIVWEENNDTDTMFLSSIFINTSLIERLFKQSSSIQHLIEQLSAYISSACGNIWNLVTDKRGLPIKVFDLVNTDTSGKEKYHKIEYNTIRNVLIDFNANFSYSQAAQLAAMYSSVGRNNTSPAGSTFGDATTNLVIPLDDLFSVYVDDLKDDDDTEEEETDQLIWDKHNPNNFWLRNQDGELVNWIYPDINSITRSMFGKNGGQIKNFGVPPSNMSISFSVEGISGINFFDAFYIDGVPDWIQELGFFFVTGINHNITDSGWITQIEARYRYAPRNIGKV